MNYSSFNDVDVLLFPIKVIQTSSLEVTYFWEIKVAEIDNDIYVSAEEKSFGQYIQWMKSDQRDKQSAVYKMKDICNRRSK